MIEVLAALGTVLGLMAVVLVSPVALDRRRRRARPQAGDKPVQIEATFDGVVTLADVVGHLTATGSTVADEFLPPAERVDRRTFATGGILLVPDDVAPLPPELTAVDPLILRTSRPGAVRLEHGSRLHRGTKAALAREAARIRRDAYDQLLRERAGRRTAVVPVLRAGVVAEGEPKPVSHWPAGMPTTGPAQAAGESRPAVRPSPGRTSRH